MQGLISLGVDVEVICPRPGPLTRQLAALNVPLQCIEMVHPWPGDEYLLDRNAVQELGQILRKKRPDVVHSHLYPAHLHASLAAEEVGIPAIVHTAHTVIVRPGDALLSYVTAARTIAASRAADRLLEDVGVPPERIEVIYNGVGSEHFEQNLEAQQHVRADLNIGSGPIVGMVSRLSPEKGVDVLLRAVQQVVQVVCFPGDRLVVTTHAVQLDLVGVLERCLNRFSAGVGEVRDIARHGFIIGRGRPRLVGACRTRSGLARLRNFLCVTSRGWPRLASVGRGLSQLL